MKILLVAALVVSLFSCGKKDSSNEEIDDAKNQASAKDKELQILREDTISGVAVETQLLAEEFTRMGTPDTTKVDDCSKIGSVYGRAKVLGKVIEHSAPNWNLSSEKLQNILLLTNLIQSYGDGTAPCSTANFENLHLHVQELRQALQNIPGR